MILRGHIHAYNIKETLENHHFYKNVGRMLRFTPKRLSIITSVSIKTGLYLRASDERCVFAGLSMGGVPTGHLREACGR